MVMPILLAGLLGLLALGYYLVAYLLAPAVSLAASWLSRTRCQGCGARDVAVRLVTPRRPRGIPLCARCASADSAVVSALAIWGDHHPEALRPDRPAEIKPHPISRSRIPLHRHRR